jgi:hypothetical protein
MRFIDKTNPNYLPGWIPITNINVGILELNKNNYNPLMKIQNNAFPGKTQYADWPQQLNAKYPDGYNQGASGLEGVLNTSPFSTPGEDSSGLGWANYIRCFNFADFTGVGGIEYAWTVTGLKGAADVTHPEDRTVAWLTVDDLNNPLCVPWQGENAATNFPAGEPKAFPYYRSAYTNSRTFTSTEETVLYAKTPYADYVTTLFTDKDFATVSKPTNENAPFLNYNLALDSSDYIDSLLAWDYGDPATPGLPGEAMNLQIVSEFNPVNGNRISNAVGSQTTASLVGNGLPLTNGNSNFTFDEPSDDVNGGGARLNRGYSRFKTTFQPTD